MEEYEKKHDHAVSEKETDIPELTDLLLKVGTQQFLETLSPYITGGEILFDGDDGQTWKFTFDPENKSWQQKCGTESFTDQMMIHELEQKGYEIRKKGGTVINKKAGKSCGKRKIVQISNASSELIKATIQEKHMSYRGLAKEEIIKYVKEHATSTILSFPDRGSSWGSSSYRGNFSGWIPASIIVRYGCKSVSEIFAGGGTTSDVCRDLEIPYCGIDLNPNPVRPDISVMDILDYTKDLPDGFYQSDLQILHPPYPGINDIHYSNHMWKGDSRSISADIQEMPWEKGMHAVNQAMMRGYAAMPKGAYQAVVVGDIRQKGIFRSMLTNLTLPGEQIQVLIKKQHNTSSERKYYANHKFFFIEHEYIVITKKPSGYEIAFVVPQHYTMDIRDSQSATCE